MAAVNQEIPDKQHIRELQNRYSYAIDSGHYDNLDVMFTPDATYNFLTGSTDNIEALKKPLKTPSSLSPLLNTLTVINGPKLRETAPRQDAISQCICSKRG